MGIIKDTFLITGGGGYLGSTLVPMLLEQGHQVKVLDRFFWSKEVLPSHPNLILIEADSRNYPKSHLEGVNVVIDLAALSNDPIAELSPQTTYDVNYHARVRTATLAKAAGVKKYILASSCSVYGFQEGLLNEQSPTQPITTYAKASELAEKNVLPLADNHFCVTALRQGTLYGLSPRMRFDLVINTMTLSLFKDNHIIVHGGSQWRPILHVKDSARAFLFIASKESSFINRQIFNVGSTNQNYQIQDMAKLVLSHTKDASNVMIKSPQGDFRSYQVNFEKIANLGYQTLENPKDSAKEIYKALKESYVVDTLQTKTIEWYKHLLSKNPKLFDLTHANQANYQKNQVPHLQQHQA